jgi:hypothetical protein
MYVLCFIWKISKKYRKKKGGRKVVQGEARGREVGQGGAQENAQGGAR